MLNRLSRVRSVVGRIDWDEGVARGRPRNLPPTIRTRHRRSGLGLVAAWRTARTRSVRSWRPHPARGRLAGALAPWGASRLTLAKGAGRPAGRFGACSTVAQFRPLALARTRRTCRLVGRRLGEIPTFWAIDPRGSGTF